MRSRPIGVLGALAWGVGRAARDRVERPGPAPAAVTGDAPVWASDRLRVACWNLQFCAGRSDAFFYEGGPRVHVTDEERDRTLAAVVTELRSLDADVVLLQEVDVRSDRTGRLDQRRALAEALGYPVVASTPYHDVPFVPVPAGRPMGRVRCELVVLSRFRIAWATRHPLPMLDEGPLRRAFNLRRAVLEVRLARPDDATAALLNVHLSAFSHADGTLARQIAVLDRLCGERERDGVPWLLAGDMNALPPWDTASRLPPAHAAEYQDDPPPLGPLWARWRTPLPAGASPATYGTYVPLGAGTADRCIDHVFHGAGLAVEGYRVRAGLGAVSDHLPLAFDARIERSR